MNLVKIKESIFKLINRIEDAEEIINILNEYNFTDESKGNLVAGYFEKWGDK